MVGSYNDRCYETMNTGPDRLTQLYNGMCSRWNTTTRTHDLSHDSPELHGVMLHDGMMTGPVSTHRVSNAPR